MPSRVSSLQMFFVRHGLTKNLLDPNALKALHEISTGALKLLNWMTQQEIINVVEIDYTEMIAMAENWTGKLRTPMPSLLLLWASCAVISGAEVFLSFDPRTRALAKGAGLKVLPESL